MEIRCRAWIISSPSSPVGDTSPSRRSWWPSTSRCPFWLYRCCWASAPWRPTAPAAASKRRDGLADRSRRRPLGGRHHVGRVRGARAAPARDAATAADADVLSRHVASVVGGGAPHAPGRPPCNLRELLRAVVAARAGGPLGAGPRRRVRPPPERP